MVVGQTRKASMSHEGNGEEGWVGFDVVVVDGGDGDEVGRRLMRCWCWLVLLKMVL